MLALVCASLMGFLSLAAPLQKVIRGKGPLQVPLDKAEEIMQLSLLLLTILPILMQA